MGARTIRKKITEKLPQYLTDFPPLPAAPSPHRPHHPCRPCRRKKHLTSLAEAAGIELEEMIFFDNERGNCLVRICAYLLVHQRYASLGQA